MCEHCQDRTDAVGFIQDEDKNLWSFCSACFYYMLSFKVVRQAQ